eukprot:m51a1_g6079 putative axin dorsalization-associated protein (343) ;mRNA; r:306057-307815
MAAPQRAKWAHTLADAVERDSWGQHVEACEQYSRIAAAIAAEAEGLGRQERVAMSKARLLLLLRRRELLLHARQADEVIPLDYLRKILPVIEGTKPAGATFPVDLHSLRDSLVGVVSEEESEATVDAPVDTAPGLAPTTSPATSPPPKSTSPRSMMHKFSPKLILTRNRAASAPTAGTAAAASTTLPKPRLSPRQRIDKLIDGTNNLCVHIERATIAFKADKMREVHMTVSLVDALGQEVEPPQETPRATGATGTELEFGCCVKFVTPVDAMGEGLAVVFEVKHWKAKGNYVSTKCWAVLERANIKEGPVVLDLFKKPTDLTRKKVQKLGSLLYLHARLEYF